MIEKDILKSILREDFEYPEAMLDKTADKLLNLTPELSNVFFDWLETRNDPEITIEGFSFTELVEKYKMNKIGAFLSLDWLKTDPQTAAGVIVRGNK